MKDLMKIFAFSAVALLGASAEASRDNYLDNWTIQKEQIVQVRKAYPYYVLYTTGVTSDRGKKSKVFLFEVVPMADDDGIYRFFTEQYCQLHSVCLAYQ